jgi:hypothetical protein
MERQTAAPWLLKGIINIFTFFSRWLIKTVQLMPRHKRLIIGWEFYSANWSRYSANSRVNPAKPDGNSAKLQKDSANLALFSANVI